MTDFLQQVLVYLDDDFIIVNKPAGLLSVPGKGEHLADCLIARLKLVMPEILLIHRLDRDTSGVMVFARNIAAQRHISKQFELRQTSKQYVALVLGELTGQGSIDIPVCYDPTRPPLHIVAADYHKNALTHWRVMEQLTIKNQVVSRVELTPITGRSHQLRVHLQYIGHAIVGDALYADAVGLALSERLCLHAKQLAFAHPTTGEVLSFAVEAGF